MVSREQVMEALRTILDPELRRSIVDLDMVKDVRIQDTRVEVDVLLTVAGCPLHREIESSVKARVGQLPGVEEVHVTLGEMTPEQRQALVNRLSGRRQARSSILDPASNTQIIGISSGKGGVGKSTVTANLAVALARLGHRVGVIDADIYGFSIPRILGLKGRPMVIEGALAPQTAHGVQAISMGSLVDEETAVIWRGPMLMKALEQFLKDVLWGDLDYLLLDMPPGTGDIAISMYQLIPQSYLLLVTTPQPVASVVARRVAKMAEKTNQTVVGVIENMAYFICPHCGHTEEIFGRGGGQQIAEALGVPLLARLPLDRSLRESGDEGQPLAALKDDRIGQAFLEAARALHERLAEVEPTGVPYVRVP
ncbi:MAG: Mrp/NBP35 family ATP-binding protein [Limnochordaceae bacterium]|uniref:Iron-sulfur cluster carrier protein n=1 Tax=Carboxydichorda subterranea TaxID=3109565 RepID=A0ABZ1BTX2_9FIRM|nr:Mrp/NBP35 family ATP-binding protein [Limnochorda sp. L945t]MBE3598618.1 Mrp/NBP35 family ATP-binding protein [Limnochordaceae bacterium]WRP16088.1 Mrp/NBP35 family ATP-binding protein [Limnochorda sp. L945t]